MSTKRIQQVLDASTDPEAGKAKQQLMALRKACQTLVRHEDEGGVSRVHVEHAWDTIRAIALELP